MLALTIRQPWADSITRGIKLIENRTWAPPGTLFDRQLAIHASRKIDHEGAERYRCVAGADARGLDEMPLGAVTAIVRVVGALHLETRATVGDVTPVRLARIASSPWTVGPWAWLLEDLVTLPAPIGCRGSQGLWYVPRDVKEQIALALDTRQR